MALLSASIDEFTAFKKLNISFNPGLNIFLGDNGTGKTHLLKLLYSACSITRKDKSEDIKFPDKLVRVFYPSKHELGRLVNRAVGRKKARVEICGDDAKLEMSFSTLKSNIPTVKGEKKWYSRHLPGVYIPVKEMLANSPGFVALYNDKEIHFEEIYKDIIETASRPVLRGPASGVRKILEENIEASISGKIISNDGEFFLQNSQGFLEFTLLSEGMRKLGLLLLLIRNGSLGDGSILFWDEPETNLNPMQMKGIVKTVFSLADMGIQIFLATHNSYIVNELSMYEPIYGEKMTYHSFYRDGKSGNIMVESASALDQIENNAIDSAFGEQYSRLYTVAEDD